MDKNSRRQTPTWKLWLAGIAGGIVIAALMFTGSDPSDTAGTARAASTIGHTSIRVLLIGVILAGGWSVLRRK